MQEIENRNGDDKLGNILAFNRLKKWKWGRENRMSKNWKAEGKGKKITLIGRMGRNRNQKIIVARLKH